MFTLVDFFRLAAFLWGAAIGGAFGWEWFGILGLIFGVVGGFFLGGGFGWLFFFCVDWFFIDRKLRAMTTEELRSELHAPNCLMPNVILYELHRRGEEIRSELPLVYSLLKSEDPMSRCKGWDVLTGGFPDLAAKIPDYKPTQSSADCKKHCQPLEELIPPS